MGMTLVEAAKLAENDLTKGVISIFALGSPILGRLTFEDAPGGVYPYNVETTLPGIAFRAVNGTYTQSSGILTPHVEKVKILGGECDYDIALYRRFGEARRILDIKGKITAQARYFDKMFFDGDEASDPLQFDGLNKRLIPDVGTDLDAHRVIYVDGSGTAGAALTENAVQRLIDSIYGGPPDMICMGKFTHRQMSNLFKGSTLWAFAEPNYFGYRPQTFSGIEIAIIDRDNQDNVILAADETVGTSSAMCSSMYALKFGPQFLSGIQTAMPSAKDFGEIPSAPVMRFRSDWDCGIKIEHPRCASRLAGILAAAGVL
jgi:hypothetical protein